MSIATYKKATPRTKVTPQTEPIPGESQVENSAGGHVYSLDKWATFLRFLILGTEGGTYYITEQKYTADAVTNTIACVVEDGERAVDMIVQVSDSGRAPKNDPAIFALAIAASMAQDTDTRAYALAALPKVCRIPTHLFHFVTFLKGMRGIGRGVRNALGNWYNQLPVEKLAYELVKYQSRDGIANADVLRLAHPKTLSADRNAVYRWALGLDLNDRFVVASRDGLKPARSYGKLPVELPRIITAFEAAKTATDAKQIVKLIHDAKLTREMLPTEALTYPDVWQALLDTDMPYTALLRNLGNLSKNGVLTPLSKASKTVVAKLLDKDAIRKGRVHPAAVLIAMKVYGSGRSVKGKGEWTPVPDVVDALNDAFYLAFGQIVPTGKSILYGIDVSGSMGWGYITDSDGNQLPLTVAEAAAAMAMASIRSESEYYVMGFANEFRDLGITKKMTLAQALERTDSQNFGSTDCSLPMTWALKNKVKADAFVVITDNETYAGEIHPSQALRQYRQKTGINAKEVVMGMTATNFTIADPKDPGTLDVVGFDAAAPQAVSEFIRGV